jgi:hypothetical protein
MRRLELVGALQYRNKWNRRLGTETRSGLERLLELLEKAPVPGSFLEHLIKV